MDWHSVVGFSDIGIVSGVAVQQRTGFKLF